MSALQRIKGFFTSSVEETSGLEALQELLARREADLRLTADFAAEPYPDMRGEETVVFPYDLYTHKGEHYGSGRKEFVLPDNGLAEQDSNLANFIREQTGADEATFDALVAVQGSEARATIDEYGDTNVHPEMEEL